MKLPWDQIEELTKYLKDNALSEISIELQDGKISIKKDISGNVIASPVPQVIADGGNAPQVITNANLKEITSPMVGTYYGSSSPGADPFIKVGATIKKGDVLCIIEAMKIMNELPSEVDGIVKEIAVSDGSIVEFGQVLVRIETK